MRRILRDGRAPAHHPQRHAGSQRTPMRGHQGAQPDRVHELDLAQVDEDLPRVTVQQPLDLAVEFRRPVQVERPAQLDDRRQATLRGGELQLVRHGLSSLTEQQSRRSRLLP